MGLLQPAGRPGPVGRFLPVRTLDDLLAVGVRGRRIFLRADLNVPLDGTTITDDGRIRASLPTITRLVNAGARVIVAAHLGRPKGAPDPRYTLRPVADRLAALLGAPVEFALDTVGESARLLAGELRDGDVLLLENVRFEAAETAKIPEERRALARAYAELVGGDGAAEGTSDNQPAGAYVDDAFGAVHRAHASVYDIAEFLPHYAGDLVRAELDVLQRLTSDPKRPYVVALGGSKVSDKLAVIESLLPKVDRLLVGGGMCFTFLAAQGHGVGDSLLETEMIATCQQLLEQAGDRLLLPTDVVVAEQLSASAATQTVAVDSIPDGWKGLDIGPATARTFARAMAGAQTIFWNGPMGVFELEPFAAGTRELACAVAATSGLSVVGGGDSAAAIRLLGLDESAFGHISTGGGASLEYLEGAQLPGIAALERP